MISVILATHNGAEVLERSLAAMAALRRPAGGAEVIAVDNASTDATAEILRAHAAKVPLTVLHEPRRGKSFALNRGLAAASGDLLVFTDDDVLPDPDWLEAYAEAARRHPECRLFAGQVRHQWDAPPPRWLDYLAGAGLSFGGTPLDREEGPISYGQVKGANFMVPRWALGETRFCEAPGVNYTGTHTSAGGVDTRFALDILGREGAAWFVPEARLRHIVRARQVGLRPVFQRYLRIGAGTIHQNPDYFAAASPKLFGYPLSGLGAALRHAAGGAYRLLRRQDDQAARRMVFLALTLGRMREWRLRRLGASRA